MSERVILADCCEDWIIDWGGFYLATAALRVPRMQDGLDEVRGGDVPPG